MAGFLRSRLAFGAEGATLVCNEGCELLGELVLGLVERQGDLLAPGATLVERERLAAQDSARDLEVAIIASWWVHTQTHRLTDN